MNLATLGQSKFEAKIEEYIVLHDGLLLKETPYNEKTASGIILGTKKENQLFLNTFYEVIKVGPEVVNIKVGDHVVLGNQCQPHFIVFNNPITKITEQYYQSFENWVLGIYPHDGPREVKPSAPKTIN